MTEMAADHKTTCDLLDREIVAAAKAIDKERFSALVFARCCVMLCARLGGMDVTQDKSQMIEMTDYNVRCCCQPTKILGLLRLPTGLRSGDVVHAHERGTGVGHPIKMMDFTQITRISLELLRDAGAVTDYARRQRELAVYSDDRPIEFWRKIQGFTEVKT